MINGMMATTEDIFRQAIIDIENGDVKTIKEDPVNGFLQGNNKNLTKRNVCAQTAKYNNGVPFSRPTLDSYRNISDYIMGTKKNNNPEVAKKEIKELKDKLALAQEVINQLKEDKNNLASENYRLNELNKNNKRI